jgi:hypothetical protein
VRRYRGRYLITAILFVFELPVFVALAIGAAVTRALALAASLARRAAGRPAAP